jgi:hypothetical protein
MFVSDTMGNHVIGLNRTSLRAVAQRKHVNHVIGLKGTSATLAEGETHANHVIGLNGSSAPPLSAGSQQLHEALGDDV